VATASPSENAANGVRRSTATLSVLIVDDEESVHRSVKQPLRRYRTIAAYSGAEATRALTRHHIDVILLDLHLPDTNGFDLLQQITTERDDVEIIVLTAHSEIKSAVRSVKLGAFDFLVKSFETYQHLEPHIERALVNRRRKREQIESRQREVWLTEAYAMLEATRSEALADVVRLARRVARTPISVLLEGETGVGKEVLARYIHAWSDRADGPFVAVNVASVPSALLHSYLFGHVKGAFTGADKAQAGRFELAFGGTIFLDEVGELSPEIQVHLLRVLQEREVERLGAPEATPVDVRILAATNKRLAEEVEAGRFREDLFYRLNTLRLVLPPLRDRTADLPELCAMLSRKHSLIMRREPPRFAERTLEVLGAYEWPGNVRELENLVMRLCALYPGVEITDDDVPPEYWLPTLNEQARAAVESRDNEGRLYQLATSQFQRYLVRMMIKRADGSKKDAARMLGVAYSTVKDKSRDD